MSGAPALALGVDLVRMQNDVETSNTVLTSRKLVLSLDLIKDMLLATSQGSKLES